MSPAILYYCPNVHPSRYPQPVAKRTTYMPMTVQQISVTGSIGVSSSMFAVITTFQEQLEWSIRVAGGSVGLVIALISLVRLLTNKTKKKQPK